MEARFAEVVSSCTVKQVIKNTVCPSDEGIVPMTREIIEK